jgi:hypothetical protein
MHLLSIDTCPCVTFPYIFCTHQKLYDAAMSARLLFSRMLLIFIIFFFLNPNIYTGICLGEYYIVFSQYRCKFLQAFFVPEIKIKSYDFLSRDREATCYTYKPKFGDSFKKLAFRLKRMVEVPQLFAKRNF